ncbi:hypothetical protein [Paenibacillus typhae]|nr:hypothetical protein [Paenibacillus typhae]
MSELLKGFARVLLDPGQTLFAAVRSSPAAAEADAADSGAWRRLT